MQVPVRGRGRRKTRTWPDPPCSLSYSLRSFCMALPYLAYPLRRETDGYDCFPRMQRTVQLTTERSACSKRVWQRTHYTGETNQTGRSYPQFHQSRCV